MTWKTVAKWLILAALTAYAVGAAVWANAEAARGRCSGIVVEILGASTVDTVTEKGVIAELSSFAPGIKGAPLSSINTRSIERHLGRLSNFEDVQCVISSQGKLHIRIVPMVPALRVFDGNKSYYINKDGKPIRARADFFADVPIVSGHFTRSFPARDILPVARFVESDPALRNLVTMIEARDPDNIILIPRITGHVINIGDTTALDRKRAAILTAYKKILPYRGWETYDTISVKFRGQIVATRRDKSVLHRAVPVIDEEDPEEATLSGLVTESESAAAKQKQEQQTQQEQTQTPAAQEKPEKKGEPQQKSRQSAGSAG